MASVFGHALVGATLSKVLDKSQVKLLLILAMISAVLPDIDVLAFKFGYAYEHWLGHRGFTHSIFFAIIWSGVLSLIFGKSEKTIFFIVLFLATISHAILDAMTTGGLGVGFFIPFENTRYFFGCRPIQVSPIGISKFFSEWGVRVILSELLWIGVPCFVLLSVNAVKNKKQSKLKCN
ncbi:MAG: metal-dependent hydrolase [Flavobacteriaceae bacterium]|nr:metal-dependent hydrolase [Flavobacteriaceae bacterium]